MVRVKSKWCTIQESVNNLHVGGGGGGGGGGGELHARRHGTTFNSTLLVAWAINPHLLLTTPICKTVDWLVKWDAITLISRHFNVESFGSFGARTTSAWKCMHSGRPDLGHGGHICSGRGGHWAAVHYGAASHIWLSLTLINLLVIEYWERCTFCIEFYINNHL